MNPARLAFLSTAHIHTRPFIENILGTPDGRQVALVWDDVPERGRHYADMAHAPFVPSLDQALADPTVHGFVICAENTRHLDLLRRVLPLGKPVMCEKPLLTTTHGLDEILRLAREHHTPLISGYFLPFSAEISGVRDFLRRPEAGRPRRIRMINAHHAAYGRWFDSPQLAWFTRPELSGGGAFMDMGTHALHLVRTLFGTGHVVAADIRNLSSQYPDVDDSGVAVLALDCGAQAVVEASWIRQGGTHGLEIQTTTGALVESPEGWHFHAPDRPPLPVPAGPAQPTRIDRLVAAIRGELERSALDADLAAAADAVRWMAQAYGLVTP